MLFFGYILLFTEKQISGLSRRVIGKFYIAFIIDKLWCCIIFAIKYHCCPIYIYKLYKHNLSHFPLFFRFSGSGWLGRKKWNLNILLIRPRPISRGEVTNNNYSKHTDYRLKCYYNSVKYTILLLWYIKTRPVENCNWLGSKGHSSIEVCETAEGRRIRQLLIRQ